MQDHKVNHKLRVRENIPVGFSSSLLEKINTIIKRYKE
jgi:hypothetical protein